MRVGDRFRVFGQMGWGRVGEDQWVGGGWVNDGLCECVCEVMGGGRLNKLV